MSQIATKKKVVSLTYSIVDDQGEVIEQSDLPVDYLHGIDGRHVEVTLSPEEAFGQPDPELMFTDELENAPPEFRVVGAKPTFENADGESIEMTVTKIEDGKITIDGNHPFAGKTITFHVKVLAIRDAMPDELAQREVVSSAAPGVVH